MSFILDALKKSENERQQQGAAEFSSVPTSSANRSPARWLWLLAALLAVNFAVLIGILLKPDTVTEAEPSAASTNSVPTTTTATTATTRFEDQVADAIEERPVITPAPRSSSDDTPTSNVPPAPQRVLQPTKRSANLPTLDQLLLDGSLQMPELHLDIHVYSDDPAERFVFINMDKHREDSRIDAGAIVREITPDGVILEYQGRRFLLPRE